MKNRLRTLLILPVVFIAIQSYAQEVHSEPKSLPIGSKAPQFSLPGVDGKNCSLKDFNGYQVLVIISPNSLNALNLSELGYSNMGRYY